LVRIQNIAVPAQYPIYVGEAATRAELEQQVLEELIERDLRYRPAAREWAQAAIEIKKKVLDGSSPQDILSYLRRVWQDLRN